jgi:hypothetical protein
VRGEHVPGVPDGGAAWATGTRRRRGNVFYSATTGRDDGVGWWLQYCAGLLKHFPQFSRSYVEDELPMAQGWAFLSAAFELDPMGGSQPTEDCYIAQEVNRILGR